MKGRAYYLTVKALDPSHVAIGAESAGVLYGSKSLIVLSLAALSSF
jgi:hypothetical protein